MAPVVLHTKPQNMYENMHYDSCMVHSSTL